MRFPQDVANLLATTIRDVIWYKESVYSFLKSNGVPPIILKEVKEQQRQKLPTIKTVHYVLEELDSFGESGWPVAKKILTSMHYWKDTLSIAPERKEAALKSLAALQKGCEEYLREQARLEKQEYERREREMHQARVDRSAMKQLDHKLLQALRDEFDDIYPMTDTQGRGNRFEQLLNRMFSYYSERSEGSFNRMGEQLDGLFYFDKHCYYVEARWKKLKTNAGDVSRLRDRAMGGFGGIRRRYLSLLRDLRRTASKA